MSDAPAGGGASAWTATHHSPAAGLSAWSAPDPASAPAPRLDPGLELQLAERRGEWARVVCSNGWTTWVDARLLEPLPTATAAEIDGVLGLLGDALDAYRRLVAELAAGRIDQQTFQRGAFSAGLINRDGEVLMFDLDRARWARYDGITITFGAAIEEDAPRRTT